MVGIGRLGGEEEGLEVLLPNGLSERRNRILLDMVQSIIGFTNLPILFWGYTLKSACYILNKVSNKSISKIPHEM